MDMELTAPNGQQLYKDTKKQYDSFTWTTDQKGEYKFCFSNEFSTFTHKVVYFDFQVGEEKPIFEGESHDTAMTQVYLNICELMHLFICYAINLLVMIGVVFIKTNCVKTTDSLRYLKIRVSVISLEFNIGLFFFSFSFVVFFFYCVFFIIIIILDTRHN